MKIFQYSSTRISLFVSGLFMVASVIIVSFVFYQQRAQALIGAEEKAMIILDGNMATPAYLTRQHVLNTELRETLAKVKTLSGMQPTRASRKKIKDYKGYRNQVEVYTSENSEAEFSHGLCPECTKKSLRRVLKAQKQTNKIFAQSSG